MHSTPGDARPPVRPPAFPPVRPTTPPRLAARPQARPPAPEEAPVPRTWRVRTVRGASGARASVTSLAVTIRAADGYALAGTWYGGSNREAVLLVAPATGVRRRLYDAFAHHAAAAGFGVLTWDWRGTGGSRPATLRGFEATMHDWATLDLAGVVDWVSARLPTARLVALGHSFGGQAIGLAPNAQRIEALVTVGSQCGYWGLWPLPSRFRYAFLWCVAMPALSHAFGYFPARRIGLGEDLPRGVALQWAEWARRPAYLADYSGHARFVAPILSFAFPDDPYAPPAAVNALHDRYGSAEQRRRQVPPGELGLRRVGHFGFFRASAEPLWNEALEWLGKAGRA